MTMIDFNQPDEPMNYFGLYRMLINTAINDKEYAAEATKQLVALVNWFLKQRRPMPTELIEFFTNCLDKFEAGSSLDEAFNQKRGRGKPKDHSLHKRSLAVALLVLQLHRGWLQQKDIDAIPPAYRPGRQITDFSARTLDEAFADVGDLFAISDSRAKQLYEDVTTAQPEILSTESEEDLDIRCNPRIILATLATPEEKETGLAVQLPF